MTNYSAKILNNSVSALNAQQAVIATTANNISNLNTPGYARQVVDLQTRYTIGNAGTVDVGNGVQIGQVVRVVDNFVDKMVTNSTSDSFSANIQQQYLNQLQQSYSLSGVGGTIGDAVSNFFSAANQLSSDPSNIDLRSTFLTAAQTVASSINSTYNAAADLQTQADQQMQLEVQNVNGITSKIAKLNGIISQTQGTGQTNNDAQDQMTSLLNQLSEKTNYSLIRQTDGSVNITLPNGFTLVNGTDAKALTTTTKPSYGTGGASSLSGGALSYITYDYSNGQNTQDVDLTQQFTGGTLGGLLAVRGYATPSTTATPANAFLASGSIVQVASQVEAIARGLLTSVNNTYAGGSGLTGGTSSGDLNGNTTSSVFGLFTYAGATDANSDGFATNADLNASGLKSFASKIAVSITDPSQVAAARSTTTPRTYPVGDGSNMAALAQLQTTPVTLTTLDPTLYPNNPFTFTGTMDAAYSNVVTTVGNHVQSAQLNAAVATGNLTTATNQQSSVSGVNMDEEFSHLIVSQKAYQAAAKVLSIGQELLDEIIKAI